MSTDVGLIEAIFEPFLLSTKVLLMKRPRGWIHFLPFGAASLIRVFPSSGLMLDWGVGWQENKRS